MTLDRSFAAETLSEHEILLLHRIDGLDLARGPTTTLGQIADGPGIPADQKAALAGRYAASPVWKRAATSEAGQDFHRHIREIVGGQREDLATRWEPDELGRRFLERADLYDREVEPAQRAAKRLALRLSAAARSRLERHGIAVGDLLVRPSGIDLTLFRTGHGFAATRLELARADGHALTALELLEAQVLLARYGKLAWIDPRGAEGTSGAPFLLADLVHRLVCGEDRPRHAPQRVTTYTYARFAGPLPPAARDRFAVYLARHYTTDYAVAPDIGNLAFVADFETVRHAVALEGAATVVGATPERPELPAFLEDFRTVTFRRHYVPIALLARHEHAFLVERTSASVISRDEMEDHGRAVRHLEALRESALLFRLCYRFSELSYVSLHNALNRAFRDVLHLDRMMAELTSDIASVEQHLRELRDAEHRRLELDKHRRYYWATVLGGAALAGLTAYTIGKELGELAIHVVAQLRHEELPHAVELIPGALGVLLALGVAAKAMQIGFRRGPPMHEEEHAGHLTMHGMLDHMIHAAMKK
ncbi:MAG: hypothetical protein U1E23_16020 [Reyranellaceae bacterium]